MVRVIRGTIHGGGVRISRLAGLKNGQKVVVIALPSSPRRRNLSREIDGEDLGFVRGCRGRLGRHIIEEDATDNG